MILTLWLSMIPALGVGSRPWWMRSRSRSAVRICSQRPSRAPEPKVVVDGLPGRQVVGQQAPDAAGADPVADGVEQLAAGVAGGAAAGFDRWDQRLE